MALVLLEPEQEVRLIAGDMEAVNVSLRSFSDSKISGKEGSGIRAPIASADLLFVQIRTYFLHDCRLNSQQLLFLPVASALYSLTHF